MKNTNYMREYYKERLKVTPLVKLGQERKVETKRETLKELKRHDDLLSNYLNVNRTLTAKNINRSHPCQSYLD